jgi:hypothetical protein
LWLNASWKRRRQSNRRRKETEGKKTPESEQKVKISK